MESFLCNKKSYNSSLDVDSINDKLEIFIYFSDDKSLIADSRCVVYFSSLQTEKGTVEENWVMENLNVLLNVKYKFEDNIGIPNIAKSLDFLALLNKSNFQSEIENDYPTPKFNIKAINSESQSQMPKNANYLSNKAKIKENTNVSQNLPIVLDFEENFVPDNQPYLLESFCEGFFISGLPQKNSTKIPESEKYPASCRHKECSTLPAYKTEIISRFPRKDKDSSTLEINQVTSSLCFPYGIKICYHQKEEENIPPKNFYTVITNERGKINYVYVYNIFQRVDFIEYKSKYDADPVKDHFLGTGLSSEHASNSLEKQIDDNYESMSKYISSDYVYLPAAICLVSKYPYTSQMEKSITVFLTMSSDLSNFNASDINMYLKHLIYELPIPSDNQRLMFYVPTCQSAIEIPGPIYKDLPIQGRHLHVIFDYFSCEMIVTIHNLMLFEQKLLFISSDPAKLTEITQAFIYFLYPMTWGYTYIPILSESMIKYLQSFMPFIMGIDEYMLRHIIEYFDEDSNVTLISIKEKGCSIIHTSNEFIKSKKKTTVFPPEFPKILKTELVNDLQRCKKLKDRYSSLISVDNNSNFFSKLLKDHDTNPHYHIDKCLRKIFIRNMIRLFGEYKKYVSFIDDLSYFNQASFLETKKEKSFFQDLTSTGMFRAFIQSKESIPYFSKMCQRHIRSSMSPVISAKKTKSSGNPRFDSPELSLQKNIGSFHRAAMFNSSPRKQSLIPSVGIISSEFINITLNAMTGGKEKNQSLNISANPSDTKPTKISSSNDCNLNTLSNVDSSKVAIEYENSYLVPPYFIIDSPLIGSDSQKIEELINQRDYSVYSEKSPLFQTINKKIFPSDFMVMYNCDEGIEFNRYLIPGQEFAKKLTRSFKKSSREMIITTSSEEIAGVEKMKNTIQEAMGQIFTGEIKYDSFDKNELQAFLMSKIGRNYFSRIVYQSKFKDRKYHILNDMGFEMLLKMIFSVLLLGKNDSASFEDVRYITKSLFCYYKIRKAKEAYYLFQEISKKKPFDIWLNEAFWMKWFQSEVNERQKCTQSNLPEDVCFMILMEIGAAMNDLNIDINTQKDCLIEKIAKHYLIKDTELSTALEATLIRQYRNKEKMKEYLCK